MRVRLFLISSRSISVDDVTIPKNNGFVWINSGVAFEFPENHYGEIKDKSSVAGKGLCTSAGIIDQDFRGAVGVAMMNTTDTDVKSK